MTFKEYHAVIDAAEASNTAADNDGVKDFAEDFFDEDEKAQLEALMKR